MGDVCCDGLTGLPDAIGVVWPAAVVQLCVMYLIRASLRYASPKHWVPLSRDLRPIYTAPDDAATAAAPDDLAAAWAERRRRCATRSRRVSGVRANAASSSWSTSS